MILVVWLALLLTLSSCDKNISPLEIITTEVDTPLEKAPDIAPLEFQRVEWVIIKQEGDIFYALNSEGYNTMLRNTLELRRYIGEQQNVIIYYEDNIFDKPDDNAQDR